MDTAIKASINASGGLLVCVGHLGSTLVGVGYGSSRNECVRVFVKQLFAANIITKVQCTEYVCTAFSDEPNDDPEGNKAANTTINKIAQNHPAIKLEWRTLKL